MTTAESHHLAGHTLPRFEEPTAIARQRDAVAAEHDRLLDEVAAAHRRVAVAEAERLAAVARFRRHGERMTMTSSGGATIRPSAELAFRSDRAELSAALLVSERQAETWFGLAAALDDLPLTRESFEGGQLSARHVSEIVAASAPLDREERARLEQQAVPLARTVTPPRLRRRLHALVERLDEAAAPARHETARTLRDVWMQPARDGMAYVTQHCPAVEAVAMMDELDREAAAARDAGDTRTTAQLRSDLLTARVLGTSPKDPQRGIRPSVALMVPALSALGQSSEMAVLEGYGPMDPVTASRLAAEAPSFQRILTHPVTGAVLHVDRTSYRPTEEMRRYLRMRDGTCRFPNCNRRVERCELDHCVAWAEGGGTNHDNLAHLCKSHHDLKHHSGWGYGHLGLDGDLLWTAPSGRTYRSEPTVRMGSVSVDPQGTAPRSQGTSLHLETDAAGSAQPSGVAPGGETDPRDPAVHCPYAYEWSPPPLPPPDDDDQWEAELAIERLLATLDDVEFEDDASPFVIRA